MDRFLCKYSGMICEENLSLHEFIALTTGLCVRYDK